MKRTRPSEIKALLAARDIHPSRVLGQNFLIDGNILRIIVDSAHLADTDTVLEVGPGLGVLTEPLAARAGRVIAIEKDPRLSAYLREEFGSRPNVHLIEGDALEQGLADLLRTERITHVVSNLPYAVGTRVVLELAEADTRPLRMVVMLQLDVAERLAAPSGSKAYGVASIFMQLYYDVVLRKTVSPTCFYPPPDVRSAIVECYRRAEPVGGLRDGAQADALRALVRHCFSQRRKQIGRILQDAPPELVPDTEQALAHLSAIGVSNRQGPESMAVADWVQLAMRLTA